jgi:hypothetical protein
MRCFLFLLLASFFPLFVLPAQEEKLQEEKVPVAETFPLALVLEVADAKPLDFLWRPDWPLEMPPDLFKVISGNILSLEALTPSGSLRFSRNRNGLVTDFPFFLKGEMFQAGVVYNSFPRIERVSLEPALVPKAAESGNGEAQPNELPPSASTGKRELEVLEYAGEYPSLLRMSGEGGAWAFILLRRGGDYIEETWYDETGNALGWYEYRLTPSKEGGRISSIKNLGEGGEDGERYFYDSRFLVTAMSGGFGEYSVSYYRENLPRYWEQRPPHGTGRRLSLQWDEQGFLVRIRDGNDEAGFVDCRYEYRLDEKGNWIERREIRMIRRFGVLVSSPGPLVRRILEYGESQ